MSDTLQLCSGGSFERVDESARYLFLMLCLSERARRESVARLCCIGRGYDYEFDKDVLLRHSLLDAPLREGHGEAVFRVSWAAQEFANSSLTGSVSRRIVEDDISFLDILWRHGCLYGKAAELFKALVQVDGVNTPFAADRNKRLADYLASSDPLAATLNAKLLLDSNATVQEKRSALTYAVELDQSNAELWTRWSILEENVGDYRRSLDLALRAVDFLDSADSLEQIGRIVIRQISDAREQLPRDSRRLYTGGIIERLERQRDELRADALVTLGWLHLISFRRPEAASAAQAALAADPRNGRAQDLLRRTKD